MQAPNLPGGGLTGADVEPFASEQLHAAGSLAVTVIPLVGLGVAAWQVWNRMLHWHDLVVFAVTYLPIGLGVTVGFHRHFGHRAFKAGRALRLALGALGSAALEGPLVAWVANHRKHHAFSDREGDPHSPHVGHGGELEAPLRGLIHAHLGLALPAQPTSGQGALRARPAVGRGGSDIPAAPHHLLDQLAVPLPSGAGASPPTTSRATWAGWLSPRW